MTAAGLTFLLAVSYWLVTALYGALASQAFVQEQFLEPRLFTPAATFADWHVAIGLVLLGSWAFAAARTGQLWTRRGRAAGLMWAAGLAVLAVAAPLAHLQTTSAALIAAGTGVVQIVMLALAELRPFGEARPGPIRDRSTADLSACVIAAIAITVLHSLVGSWQNGAPSALIRDAALSLRVHLLLAGAVFLVLAAVRSTAALTPRPAAGEAVLTVAALGLAIAGFLFNVLLASVSIRGTVAIAIAAGLGTALAAAAGARGAAGAPSDDGVAAVFRPLAPRASATWPGLALWFACVGLLAWAAATASRSADWNFVLLRSGVALTWLLGLAGAVAFSRRIADGGAVRAFGIAALLLVGHIVLGASSMPVRAASMHDASGKWLAEAFDRRPAMAPAADLAGLLHAHTNISRDTQVAPVEITLAPLATPSAGAPHIFMFVIDSLRRDYLSPYNPAVSFTPSIDALARDSLVYRQAFTQYGATGLSVPSLWTGGQILHKQYVTPYAPMNTLAKLLSREGYAQWIGMDNILDVILPPSESRIPLNRGVSVKDIRLCSTLQELTERIGTRSAGDPPIFAYSLPQDIHVSVITREGSASIDEGQYSGFHAPVASRVRRFDACLGRFVDSLKTKGLYDQSIIVVTSDHGDSLGEEGRMGHAYSLHPEIVRVPLIVHVPAVIRQAWQWAEKRPAFTTDLTPTLYRILGHDPHAQASFFGEPLAWPLDARVPASRERMVAASYGAVYGALLDGGSSYYVFDAIAMRELAFKLADEPSPGSPVELTADVQQRGRSLIRKTVSDIAAFYKFGGPDTAQSR
jgi:arylsulfatase A-like enzyme